MESLLKKDGYYFTKQSLEDALIVITSLINKCEKSKASISNRNSQRTLLTNRIESLQIAVVLLNKEIQNQNYNSNNCL